MVTIVFSPKEHAKICFALSRLCNMAMNAKKNYCFSCQQVLSAIQECFLGSDFELMNYLYNFRGNLKKVLTYGEVSKKYGYRIDDIYQIEAIKLRQLRQYLKKVPQFRFDS